MKQTSRRQFITTASLASITALAGSQAVTAKPRTKTSPTTAKSQRPVQLRKSRRDLMQQVLDTSSTPSYIPAGFFMHFGVRGDAAIKAHLDYFRATGMDFVKIQFDEQGFKRNDAIKTPKDWTQIPVRSEAWFEPSLYLLKSLIDAAKSEAMIIQTLYSPYQMAKQAVSWQRLVEHVNEDAESVCRGMENITLSIMNFVQAAARLGVDGFYTCTQGGETNRLADRALFNRAIKNYDMILFKEVAQRVPYNILHVCDYEGSYRDFTGRFQDYPGQVVNVPLSANDKSLSLSQAADLFNRPVMGGLDRHGVLSKGSPAEVQKATRDVLEQAPAHVILGANCTVSRDIPMENLQAAIKTAHEFRT